MSGGRARAQNRGKHSRWRSMLRSGGFDPKHRPPTVNGGRKKGRAYNKDGRRLKVKG